MTHSTLSYVNLTFYLVPGEPRDVEAKPYNSSTVIVVWKPPSDDKQNGVIRAYQIYIQPKNTVSNTKLINWDYLKGNLKL